MLNFLNILVAKNVIKESSFGDLFGGKFLFKVAFLLFGGYNFCLFIGDLMVFLS